jgi:hypothetical protein
VLSFKRDVALRASCTPDISVSQVDMLDIFTENPMLCPICNTEKHRKDFHRKATLAQTRAWLKKPTAQKPLRYYGKDCNECYRKTKRAPREMSPYELTRRLASNAVNPIVAQTILTKRKARTTAKKSVVAKQNLRQQREPLYAPMMSALNKFVPALKRKSDYYAQRNPEVGEFFQYAYLLSKHAKLHLRHMIREGKAPPHSWQATITEDKRAELRRLATCMPFDTREKFTVEINTFEVPDQPQRLHRQAPESLAIVGRERGYEERDAPEPLPDWLEKALGK